MASRRGLALVAALVCLLVVMSLIGSMLQSALRSRRQLHAERDLRQTELLLEAGADRAAFRLRSDADYAGETWDVPAGEIIGRGDGQVVLEVKEAENGARQVRVLAEYPRGSELSIRRSRTFIVQVSATQAQE
jgi:type II secretory pathway component PulK